jgi:hypothetical protein
MKKVIYKPQIVDEEKCLAIRRISKRGGYISPEDSKMCYKLGIKYPEWYSATEPIIFNDTVPFGSDVHGEVDYELLKSMIVKPNPLVRYQTEET